MERVIQLCKTKVRHRTHQYPEKVLSNFLLEYGAIELYKAQYPRVEELASKLSGPHTAITGNVDAVDNGEVGGSQMLGVGRIATEAEWLELKTSVAAFCSREAEAESESHWANVDGGSLHTAQEDEHDDGSLVSVYIHTYASLRGTEMYTSVEHPRGRTRESCFLSTTYEVDGRNVTYIALVKKLVKLVHVQGQESHCLRFAWCDFYKRNPPHRRIQYLEDVVDDDTGSMWKVSHAADTRCWSDRGYLVEMSTINTKVMKCKKVGDGGNTLYFVPYAFSSGLI